MITKAEAIKILKHCGAESHCYDFNHGKHCEGCNQRIALDMAVEALKAEDNVARGVYECFHCGQRAVCWDSDV